MSPRSLWIILIKIFGLFLLWQSVTLISQFISTFTYLSNFSSERTDSPMLAIFLTIFFYSVIAVVYIIITRYCLFRTAWVVEKLQLSKGFDEEQLGFNIHHVTILTIVCIVIGGIILIESIPQACIAIFDYFTRDGSYAGRSLSTYSFWAIIAVIKVAAGYFMMSESRMIVNIIERNRKPAVDEAEE